MGNVVTEHLQRESWDAWDVKNGTDLICVGKESRGGRHARD